MGITPNYTFQTPQSGLTRPQAQARPKDVLPPFNPALIYHPDETPTPVSDLLVDPITRKRYDIESAFDDTLLRPGPLEKVKLSLEHNFVSIPKSIYRGLKGDSRFTFSNFLDVASIPYYVGGAVLAGSFAWGGAKVNFARQAVGVSLYYLGMMAAGKGIDAFYKMKTGVDLSQKFRKANGDVEKVLASTDFPRFDLLENQDYRRMMRKMNVPSNVADPKREVQDQARDIISAARADKLILGNILAAVGAGYLARSDKWARILEDHGQLKRTWDFSNKQEGHIGKRVGRTVDVLAAKVTPALKEAIHGVPNESAWLRRSVLGGTAALGGLIFLHSWQAGKRDYKQYQSPFITNLSPALAPEQSPYTAAIQQRLPGGAVDKLPRKGVFEMAQRMQYGVEQDQDTESIQGNGLNDNLDAGGKFR